jgi:hypothetical protein
MPFGLQARSSSFLYFYLVKIAQLDVFLDELSDIRSTWQHFRVDIDAGNIISYKGHLELQT